MLGGSFATLFTLRKLIKGLVKRDLGDQRFEITVIDKNSYFEYICSLPHTLNDISHADRTLLHYKEILDHLESQLGSNVVQLKFTQAMVTKVSSDNYVEVVKSGQPEEAGPLRINFDYLVIGTGAQYSKPIRDFTALTMEERKQNLSLQRQDMDGKSVLLVGGGANGVEISSELQETGRYTKVGLVTRGSRLLPNYPEAASKAAEDYLKEHGVSVYLNTDFKRETTCQALGYDVSLDCTGFRFKDQRLGGGPSAYLKDDQELLQCVDPHSGQIWVNKYLQLQNRHPYFPQSDNLQQVSTYSNIFCLGDVALTPADEEKAIPPIQLMSKVLASNLVMLLCNDDSKPLQHIPEVFNRIYLINFGTKGAGIMLWNDLVVHGKPHVPVIRHLMHITRMKQLIEKLNMKAFRGSKVADYALSA